MSPVGSGSYKRTCPSHTASERWRQDWNPSLNGPAPELPSCRAAGPSSPLLGDPAPGQQLLDNRESPQFKNHTHERILFELRAGFERRVCTFLLFGRAPSFLKESSAVDNAPSTFRGPFRSAHLKKERLEPVTQLALCMNHNRTVCGGNLVLGTRNRSWACHLLGRISNPTWVLIWPM